MFSKHTSENDESYESQAFVGDDLESSEISASGKRFLALNVVQFMVLGFHTFIPNFTLYIPPHQCRDAVAEICNVSQPSTLNASTSFDCKCSGISANIHNGSLSWEKCVNGWEFDKSEGETLVSEFNLVCDSAWRRPLLTSLYMVGMLFGSMIGGYLSDQCGRQVVIRISYLLYTISIFALSFTSSYVSYAVVLIGTAFLHVVVYFTAFVLAQELMPESKRHVATTTINVSFGFGFLTMPLAAYLIHDWRWLIRASGIVMLVYLPVYWRWTPKSPAWTQQKFNNNVMTTDDKTIDKKSLELAKKEDETVKFESEEVFTASILCTNSVLRKRIWISCFFWNVALLVFYTLNLSSSNLGGNIYVNCALGALVDVAAYIAMTFMLSKLGRRASCMICFLLSGILCLLTPLMRSVHIAAGIASSMAGKFFVTIVVGTVVQYTGEMFPTLLRNTSVGISSMSSRFASSVAPFLIFSGEMVSLSLPYYVMGGLALLAAGLTLLLPETSNSVLPDTVQDAVALEKRFLWKDIFPEVRRRTKRVQEQPE